MATSGGTALGLGERGLTLFRRRPGLRPRTYTYDLVADFGAVPGDTAATTAALRAFNAEAQRRTRPPEGPYAGHPGFYPDASPNNLIVLNIPAGTFTHTWNQFTKQIRRLKMIGAGSDQTFLQNLNGVNLVSAIGLSSNFDYFGAFYDESSAVFGGGDNYGYLINTAPAGSTTVQFRGNFAQAANFLVGRWVLVYSYSQQQYGYPVNARYYDWAIVKDSDVATGTISLDRPLVFEHRHDRPFFGNSLNTGTRAFSGGHGLVGPARIAHIDHPDKPVFLDHEYRGFRVLGNPNYDWASTGSQMSDDAVYLNGYIYCLVDDLVVDNHLGQAMARRIKIRNSAWGWDESDKIIGECIYENCRVATISAHHAGQLLWWVIGGHLPRCSISAREARLDGVLIDGMASAGNWQHGVVLDVPNATQLLTIDGCTFRGRNQTSSQPIQNAPIKGPVTIGTGSPEVILPDGNGSSRLRITKNNAEPYLGTSWQIVDNWGEGHSIWKNGVKVDGSTVSLITGDANYIYVACTGVTFNAGDTVAVARLQRLVVQNCVGDNTGFDWGSPWLSDTIPKITWSGNQGN